MKKMDKHNLIDWIILIYGIALLCFLIGVLIFPSWFQNVDRNLAFVLMILGMNVLTIWKNFIRGLDKRLFIQQLLMSVILLIGVFALFRYYG